MRFISSFILWCTLQLWERSWSTLYLKNVHIYTYIYIDNITFVFVQIHVTTTGGITRVVWICVFQPQAVNTENLQSALFEAGVMRRSASVFERPWCETLGRLPLRFLLGSPPKRGVPWQLNRDGWKLKGMHLEIRWWTFELDEFFGNANNHSKMDVIGERFDLLIISWELYDLLETTGLMDGIQRTGPKYDGPTKTS